VWPSGGSRAHAAALKSSRPLLCAMQNADDENQLVAQRVHEQIWERRQHQLARPLLSSWTAPLRESQERGRRLVYHANQSLCPVSCVFKEVVSDAFEIGGSFFRPTKLHLRTVLLLGQAPFESRADLCVREHLSSLDLRESLLDLTQKPIVVLNRPLDRFKR
jgi:hypothetical protein